MGRGRSENKSATYKILRTEPKGSFHRKVLLCPVDPADIFLKKFLSGVES